MKYVIKNCPLYEQYDSFNLKKCKDSSSCNGIHIDFCKDINDCLLKQIVEKCKEVTESLYVCNDMYRFADNILDLLEIEECE